MLGAEWFIERWAWPTVHPNQLGMLCAVAVALATTVVASLSAGWSVKWRRSAAFVGAAMIVGLIVALVATQSRGGWVAAGSGLLILVVLGPGRHARLCACGVMIMLGIAIVCFPGGAERMATMSRPGADESWMSRIELWRAALVLVHDHPLGIGSGKFSTAYAAWYQAPDDRFFVRFVINEPLHLLCELGLWMSVVYGILTALCVGGWRAGIHQGSVVQIGVATALATYLVASFFSCFLVVSPILGVVLAPLVVAAVVVTSMSLRRPDDARRANALWLIGTTMAVAAFVAGIAALLGAVVATGDPVRTWPIVTEESVSLGGEPRNAANRARPSGPHAECRDIDSLIIVE